MSQKYLYNQFVERRDLTNLIERSIPMLEDKGINPMAFYKYLIENPEMLDPEVFAERWGFGTVPDAFRAAGQGFSNMFAGGRAKQSKADIDMIKGLPPAKQAELGFSPEVIAQMERDKAKHDADAGTGFWGGIKGGWDKARLDRQGREVKADNDKNQRRLTQRYATLQQKYKTGPFADQPATGPATAGPAVQPASGGGGGGASTVSANAGNAVAATPQAIAGELQSVMGTQGLPQPVTDALGKILVAVQKLGQPTTV